MSYLLDQVLGFQYRPNPHTPRSLGQYHLKSPAGLDCYAGSKSLISVSFLVHSCSPAGFTENLVWTDKEWIRAWFGLTWNERGPVLDSHLHGFHYILN